MAEFNPIKALTPCDESGTPTGATITNLPCPSSYVWDLEDTSAPDAGRTLDGAMHKKRIGQVVAISLSWRNIKDDAVSQILQAFNSEYLRVNYWDAMAGAYKTLVFYVGNRTAPMYNKRLGLWQNLSFKIIDKEGATKTT